MKRATFSMFAVLAATGLSIAPVMAADAPKAAPPTTLPTAVQPTITSVVSHKAAPDAKINDVIANLTQDALTPKGMPQLVTQFADGQRQRIMKSSAYAQGYGGKLDAQIASISKAWKQKYGHEFAITKAPDVMSQAFASIPAESPGHNNAKMESATIAITGMHGAAELQVPLIYEKSTDWKIAVPDSLTAEKLRDNLLAELTRVDDQSAHWASSETDAYRFVARHVLMAVLDKPLPAHADPATQASMRTTTTQPSAKAAPSPTAQRATPVSSTPTRSWWRFWTW